MNLIPLRPASGDASSIYQIVCKVTGEKMGWNRACEEEWKYDKENPFHYYSPNGQTEKVNEN